MDSASTHQAPTSLRRVITANRQLVVLVVPMATAVILSALFSFYQLYQNELEQQREILINSLTLREEVLSSNSSRQSEALLQATLDDYFTSQRLTPYLFDSREELLIRLRDGRFEVVAHAHGKRLSAVPPQQLTSGHLFTIGAEDEVLRRAAIAPQGSGIFTNYRGQQALTTYATIEHPEQRYLLVASIDIAEIRAPYLQALLIIFTITTLVAIIAVPTFGRLINPVLTRLQESLQRYRESETALRKQIKHTDAILATIGSGIITVNGDGTIQSFNRGAEHIFDTEAATVVGKKATLVIPPPARHDGPPPREPPLDMEEVVRHYAGDGREVVEQRADGTTFPARLTASKVALEGDALYVISIVDLSSQKAIEKMLRMSEMRSQAVLETVVSGIITFNRQGQILTTNPAIEKMFGYKSYELYNQTLETLLPPDYHRRYRNYIEHVDSGRSDEEHLHELVGLRKDHSTFPIWLNVGKSDLGEDELYVAIIVDISKQKADELELRKRSSIIEESPASILITDLDFHIEYVNPAFVVNSGYSEEEIIGQNVRILQSGYTPKEVYQEMFEKIKTGHPWKGELLNRKKSGELFWESTTISPIRDHDGNISHYAAIKEDVTDRKQAEEELRRHRDNLQELVAEQTAHIIAAKEEAEAANQAKSAFLANTSHEIRTPMNAIIGMSELLLETRLSDEQRGYLTTVAKSARALLELLNQILDLSKLEGGKMTLEQIPFDLHETLNEALITFYAAAKRKRIELRLDIDPTVESCRIGDPTRLRQIIINLVGNALKFTSRGHVTISVEAAEQSDQLHFSVADSGIGIPPERLDAIFESFTQADQSTARKHGGTGLGTTISKQFVELMNGRIWVESEVGVGSNFHFTIETPATDSAICQQRGERQRWRATRPLNILLVDDVEENIELATVRLEQRDHLITAARNGREALHAYMLGHYDIILMDIQMPEMNGYEATTEIRRREEAGSEHIPIIAMTASVLKQDRERCLSAGMDAFVSKPVDFDELYRVMAKLLPDAFEQIETPPSPPSSLSFEKQGQLRLIDLHAAIDIWGDEKAYRTALHHFVTTNREMLEQFQQHLANNSLSEAKQLAHKLKGVAGNLALKALEEITKKLDSLLKKKDINATRTLLPQFTHRWEETIAQIDQHLSETEPTPTPEQSAVPCETPGTEAAAYIDELLTGLDRGDPDEVEEILDRIKTLIHPDQLNTIEHYIFEFDFTGAAKETLKLAQALGLDLQGRER